MNELIDFFANTPWWVYVIFIFIIKRGISASETRVIPVRKLFILPLIFFLMSVHTLVVIKNPTILDLMYLFISFVIASCFGFVLTNKLKIIADRANALIQIEGSWVTLILILLLFSTKYFLGYSMEAHPDWIHFGAFRALLFSVSGIGSGLFLGRLACYLRRYFMVDSDCKAISLVN